MNPSTLLIGSACFGLLTTGAQAQSIEFSTDATLDRWMYPFNGTPGNRLSASTFGIPRLEGFDDHDAQLILGFRTQPAVPSGLDPGAYRITGVRVFATVSNGNQFRYDPTYDSHLTYQNQVGNFPGLVPDQDPGRPVMLWGVGYRDGFTRETWQENSGFGNNPTVLPSQETRTAFIAVFDADGVATDASNQLKDGVDLDPMAVGQTDMVSPGTLVPSDTTFVFEVDLCDPGTQAYLAEGLGAGELRFGISSLHAAEGGPEGGTGETSFPIWYTRENPIAQILGYTAHMEIEVRVGSVADYNEDGAVNVFDVFAFLNDLASGNPAADINRDCALNVFDVFAFLDEYNTP